MHANSISPVLRDRLGHEATLGLLELVESAQRDGSDRMLSVAADRFERRLAEELSELRVALVREIHEGRFGALKWAFLFGAGQLAAIAALLGFMFRVTGR